MISRLITMNYLGSLRRGALFMFACKRQINMTLSYHWGITKAVTGKT